MSHVTLDVFTPGARPKCIWCNLPFSSGASAWTCYRCVQNYWAKLPIPNGIVDHSLEKGFAFCVQCAYNQPFDVDSQDAEAPLTWGHSRSDMHWDNSALASHAKLGLHRSLKRIEHGCECCNRSNLAALGQADEDGEPWYT